MLDERGYGQRIMKTVFKWLCAASFCIVLFAIAIGVFELAYFSDPKAKFLGCTPAGDFAGIACDDPWLLHVKELVFNLPLGLAVALPVTVRFSDSADASFMAVMYAFDLVLVLAMIQVLRILMWLVRRRWRVPAR